MTRRTTNGIARTTNGIVRTTSSGVIYSAEGQFGAFGGDTSAYSEQSSADATDGSNVLKWDSSNIDGIAATTGLNSFPTAGTAFRYVVEGESNSNGNPNTDSMDVGWNVQSETSRPDGYYISIHPSDKNYITIEEVTSGSSNVLVRTGVPLSHDTTYEVEVYPLAGGDIYARIFDQGSGTELADAPTVTPPTDYTGSDGLAFYTTPQGGSGNSANAQGYYEHVREVSNPSPPGYDTSGLLYWYRINSKAPTVYDTAGNYANTTLKNGTNNGATWVNESDTLNYSLDFDGSGDYVNLGNIDATTNFTVMGRIKWDGASTSFDAITAGGYDGSSYPWLLWNDNGNEAQFKTFGSSTATVGAGKELPTNTWVLVTGVRDSSADEYRIYFDGTLEGTTSSTVDITTNNNNADDWLGAQSDQGSPRYEFDGHIDEVRFYNQALSQSRISAIA